VAVAVADQVPGVGAVEDAVGVDAAPAGALRGLGAQRAVADLDGGGVLDRAAQGVEVGLGARAGAVEGGEGEGVGGLGGGGVGGVELGAQAGEDLAQAGVAAEDGVGERQAQDCALAAGEGERREARGVEQAVAAVVADQGDVGVVQRRQIAVGGALRDLEAVCDVVEGARTAAVEVVDERDEAAGTRGEHRVRADEIFYRNFLL
jgi:hypothetical protein